MLEWLSGLFSQRHQPSATSFQGILKFNTVFVTDRDLAQLSLRGFGARRLRKIVYPKPYIPSKKVADDGEDDEHTTSPKVLETKMDGNSDDADSNMDEEGKEDDKKMDVESKVNKQEKKGMINPDDEDDDSPMILFDEEAFYLHRMGLLELQHSNGTTVTQQVLWERFCEKNTNFPHKFRVYAYFRDQNFVVKTGIHYGLDYAVYRTLPSHCHSEFCVLLVDGTERVDVTEGPESVAGKCQLGWRHVSTLTRVMPDVMKLLLVCYVQPIDFDPEQKLTENDGELTNADILADIFRDDENAECRALPRKIDYSTPACLDELTVRPVTTLIRRLPTKGEYYQTIGDKQTQYRSCSILKKVRLEQTKKKKRRKRRDHQEVRLKAVSKHSRIWKQLLGDNSAKGPSSKKAKREAKRAAALAGGEVNDVDIEASRSQEKKKKKAKLSRVFIRIPATWPPSPPPPPPRWLRR